jgi:hypothetical protein
VRSLGDGDVRVKTNALDHCRVVLRGAEDEPVAVGDPFAAAAAA